MASGSSLRSRLNSSNSTASDSQATVDIPEASDASDNSDGTITPEMSDFEDADAVLLLLEAAGHGRGPPQRSAYRGLQFSSEEWIWPAAKSTAEMIMTSEV
jgi:hypothetical protein